MPFDVPEGLRRIDSIELGVQYAAFGAGLGAVLGLPALFYDGALAPYAVVATSTVLAVVGYLFAQREHRLRADATSDPLTGLCNPLFFFKRLSEEIDRAMRHGHPLSLLVIDVDSATRVSDRMGSTVANRLIRSIAGRLTEACRSTDVVARRRGDEFLVLAPLTSVEAAIVLAERIEALLVAVDDELAVELSPAIGIADLAQSGAVRPRELFDAAERALFSARVRRWPIFTSIDETKVPTEVARPRNAATAPVVVEPPQGATSGRGKPSLSPAIHATQITRADGATVSELSVYCPGCGRWHAIEDRRERDTAAQLLHQHGKLPSPVGAISVGEVMTRDVFCLRPEVPIDVASAALIERGYGSAPVLDEGGGVIGVVAKTDLLRHAWDARHDAAVHVTVADIMTTVIFRVTTEMGLDRAAALMAYEGVTRLVVVSSDNRLLGMVSGGDILRWVGQRAGYVVPTLSERSATDATPEPHAPERGESFQPFPFGGAMVDEPGLRRTNTVMIIDDDESLRDDVADVLRQEGYPVITAANGADALARIRAEGPPALILLDLNMPVMNGWSFYTEMNKDPVLGRIPLVLLSGTKELEQQGARLDADDFLAKPVTLNKLLGTVKQYC